MRRTWACGNPILVSCPSHVAGRRSSFSLACVQEIHTVHCVLWLPQDQDNNGLSSFWDSNQLRFKVRKFGRRRRRSQHGPKTQSPFEPYHSSLFMRTKWYRTRKLYGSLVSCPSHVAGRRNSFSLACAQEIHTIQRGHCPYVQRTSTRQNCLQRRDAEVKLSCLGGQSSCNKFRPHGVDIAQSALINGDASQSVDIFWQNQADILDLIFTRVIRGVGKTYTLFGAPISKLCLLSCWALI